ncbi:MAG: hypothetical protein K0M63_10045 [Weeksellaceae bacterium]|nr:hypothetical protein [Weeksellaceae bacterium]
MPTNPLEIRIKVIQAKISVPQSGVYDLETCSALEKTLGLLVSDLGLFDKKKNIQKHLGFSGRDVDGIFGVNTTTRIEMFLDEKIPPLPKGASMIISKNSLQLVLESEISSKSMYNSKYKFPIWPHGASGITIGIGYDMGYSTPAQFEKDWKALLGDSKFGKLKSAVGLQGERARAALTSAVKSVEVPYDDALQVFYTTSVPVYARATAKSYPGVELLPPDAQGALLSLVYNRGASLEGPRRKEMKNIAGWVRTKNLAKIAGEIRAMKRLWEGDPKMKGLLSRRDKEAALVANARFFLKPEDYIFA